MKSFVIVPLLLIASAVTVATVPLQESRPAPAASAASSAGSYRVDSVHSSAVFRVVHSNVSPFWGMFTAPSGSFTLDSANPSKNSFTIEIKADNVVTGNEKRDNHLRSPDFFNAQQYPTITFTSSSVKGEGSKLQVTGTLDLHGVKKEITIPVEIVGTGAGMGGRQQRAGIEATMNIKMSEFEFKGNPGLADEVKFIVGLAGVKS